LHIFIIETVDAQSIGDTYYIGVLEKLYQLSNLNTLCIFIYSLYSYIELNCLV